VKTLLFNDPANVNNQSASTSQQQDEQFSVPTAIQTPNQNVPLTTQVPDSFSSPKAEDIQTSPLANSFSSESSKSLQPDFNAAMPDEPESLGLETKILPQEEASGTENISSVAQPDKFIENEIPTAPEEKFDMDASGSLKTNISQNPEAPTPPKFDLPSIDKGKNVSANAPAPDINVSNNLPQKYPQLNSSEDKPKKKSVGKSLAIAGGIGGFGIVAISAAAIGWYVLKPSATSISPTPVPQATVPVSPSVETTTAPIVETNANINDLSVDVVPSNTSITNTGDLPDTTKRSINKTIQPTPVKTEAAQRTATVPTPVRNSLPVKKPVVNKKPASDSTKILQ
jgi:hypothetical protein